MSNALNPQVNTFDETVQWLRAGKAAVFPTDTVYGLGVSVMHAHGLSALYDLKQRDAGKPIAWLVGGVFDLNRYGLDIPDYAHDLAQRFWPGALTLIVRASDAVPRAFVSPSGSVGLRMPASDITLALIDAVGSPLATTSANLSGYADTGKFDDLDTTLLQQVGCALCDAAPKSGLASTVVDCTGEKPVVLRAGGVDVSSGNSDSSIGS
ncbi:L-threonylcarbamoyladenylate synthase [Adlercreutzia sp. ZJ138]|uniref:L-threonylcarbamoyladenylate synthase n=1 Tax=Adlercreutzia sp. ZJ138 TaxID=2709405 RepID=UPI0013ECE72D|nr:L-threonylcarbamoyladenylate synthase [Adlercreutzia sp. ZJ138]